MMDKEEKKFDKLISSLMNEAGLESPQSAHYTETVVKNVLQINTEKTRLKHKRQLIVFGLLAFALVLGMGVTLFYLWQGGQLNFLINGFANLASSFTGLLPFHIPLSVLGIAGLHLILARVVVAIILFKKRESNYRFM